MDQKRLLRINNAPSAEGSCVVYVMSRDQRINDNHAFLFSQQAAIAHEVPLVVVFNLLPKTGNRSREHYQFMLEGLKEVESKLHNLSIGFILINCDSSEQFSGELALLKPIEVYFDFNPLRGPRAFQKSVTANLAAQCYVVDTHNIIPLWILSDKQEFAAHTLRSKVHKNLEQWLQEPPQPIRHPYPYPNILVNDWPRVENATQTIPVSGIKIAFTSGEDAAHAHLENFIDTKLNNYATARNLPTEEGQSDLSPYLHFGHISALRVALELAKQSTQPPLLLREPRLASYEGKPSIDDNINALLEELIVRKELADNYCFYTEHYDSIEGAKDWALKTLAEHENDAREFVYSREEWETAKTHDDAWNAAQKQMMKTGKMHGYMRMYWAKKILEWSASPAEAVRTAVYLNDKYSIDGGDPNGYTGIMWSIAGVHDRPWFDRSVYGKIRYMNASGLSKKFDLGKYIETWT